MSSASKTFDQLVVIGSSAGGIDALSTLLATLPGDFAAPIVIAQHIDPKRPSHLADILARRGPLPVRTVTTTEALAPGVVYVVPPNRNVEINDHAIGVQEDREPGPKPSVNLLLRSAAESFGERLIAVILSGSGSDGAAGASAVKQAGGTVVIQDPNTATFPGMPASLAPTTVDIVANIERIGPILVDLLAGVDLPARPDERKLLQSFLSEARERLGLDFNTYKTPTILRRLQRRIVATGTKSLEGYIRYVQAHPEEYQQLVRSFLIKVTEFFRDPDLFEHLRNDVVPEVIQQARKRGNEIRIWSAGCATGEEAYTLAILISEALGGALDHFNVRIFATDADADAVAFARRGIYPASALEHVPEDLLARYFTKDDDSYQIKKIVRTLTVFGQHDLGGRAPFPNIDILLCRNVLIYFTPELQRRTLLMFAYSLRMGGYLVMGKAETPSLIGDLFAPLDKHFKVFGRVGDRVMMPPSRPPEPPPPAPPALRHATGTLRTTGLTLPRGQPEVQRVRATAERFLLRLPIGIVVVDRRYDIQMINSAARLYLSIHSAAIGEDLIHIAQGIPQQRLRTAVDTAFRTGAPSVLEEVEVEDVTSTEPRYLQIACHPQRVESDSLALENDNVPVESNTYPAEAVLVVIHDITQLVQSRRLLEDQLRDTSAELESVRHLVDVESSTREQLIERLVDTNRQLIEANQELTSANEELRTINEEFLMNTEEAQAAIEEVETLNEELQATNEELETLNEELQATIEELNTTNDDLNARSGELQELARITEDERARLAAILVAIGDAVLVVGHNGVPLLTNAAYERLFGGENADRPLYDEEGRLLPPEVTPQQRAARGETFRMEFALVHPRDERRWYEANCNPILDGEGKQKCGVVVIRDITERSLHRIQDEFIALASHELRTPLTPIQSYLQLLLKQFEAQPEDAPVRRYAQAALAQTRRLGRLVNDLLGVQRLQAGSFMLDSKPIRLDEVVRQAVELGQTFTSTQMIRLTIDDAPLVIQGDAERLQQVLLNLLNNAITHAPDSKTIEVRVRRVGNEAEVQVEDHGPGIPAEQRPNVFSRFFQVVGSRTHQHKGLGLGLYIASGIMKAHGGSIEVGSAEGKGTTFTLRLPLAEG